MKKISTSLLFVLLISFAIFAQVPEAFNYQAVVRNSSGEIITNTNVAFRISILQGSETGTPLYVETHSVNTNNFGLVNLKVGMGNVEEGVFMPGDWGAASHFIKVEFDKDGGTGYVHLGTSPLLSVPYAFHAQTVAEDQVDDADADATNEIQELQLSGTQLTLSKNGGTVTLPSSGGGGDNWGTQTVSSDATLSGEGTTANPLKVENNAIQPSWANILDKPAGFADNNDDVEDGDANPNNEIQTLSISGNDLSISDGNTVTLPVGASSPWESSGNDIFFNSGNVGIGTANPAHKLEVRGTDLAAAIYGYSENSWGIIGHTKGINVAGVEGTTGGSSAFGVFGNDFYDGKGVMGRSFSGYAGYFTSEASATAGYFYSNLGYGLIVEKGNVGIGTDSPVEKLQILEGSIQVDKNYGLKLLSTNSFSEIKSRNNDLEITSFSGGHILLSTSESGGAAFSRLTIKNNGNIGIGTIAAEEILHIVGENPRILIEAYSSNPEINFKNTGDIPTSIWSIYKNGSNGDLHFYQNGNKLTLQKNTGNVGIGTTTPQGKLDVNGTIYQRGGVLHADYVFEENYPLESIEEHTEFMWENKHLPAIPKATTDENGVEIVEVGSHRKGIVEELEKAHIYISQLEKAILQQNKIIEELKITRDNSELHTRVVKLEKIVEELQK